LKAHVNAFAERWVRSVKEECLSKLILFGESSLQRPLNEFVSHFHCERNHQGKGKLWNRKPRFQIRDRRETVGLSEAPMSIENNR
jgi:hypothetical protein